MAGKEAVGSWKFEDNGLICINFGKPMTMEQAYEIFDKEALDYICANSVNPNSTAYQYAAKMGMKKNSSEDEASNSMAIFNRGVSIGKGLKDKQKPAITGGGKDGTE